MAIYIGNEAIDQAIDQVIDEGDAGPGVYVDLC
jgi:hypothetical protein